MQVYSNFLSYFAFVILDSFQGILTFTLCAVVWNPWDKKAKALQDLGDEDYQSMLCVDSAVIETPIILKPFEEWKGRQEISTVSSSYCSGQLDPRKVLYGFH